MIAYKLFKQRKDGTLGSLFMNVTLRHPMNKWLLAYDHTRKGFASRPGWHCLQQPNAPHLSLKDRTWCKVEIQNYKLLYRSPAQGGEWFIAKSMRILQNLGPYPYCVSKPKRETCKLPKRIQP